VQPTTGSQGIEARVSKQLEQAASMGVWLSPAQPDRSSWLTATDI
jgi:hypothetical protein